jgi:hypothetical protein
MVFAFKMSISSINNARADEIVKTLLSLTPEKALFHATTCFHKIDTPFESRTLSDYDDAYRSTPTSYDEIELEVKAIIEEENRNDRTTNR